MRVAQHGHRSRLRARATVSLLRTDAIEFGTCRSGRIGGAAGSITCGKAKRRELRGGPSRGGNSHPFGDQEAIGCDAKRGVMVEAAPAAALEVPEPEFLLELLIVAFDAPPELQSWAAIWAQPCSFQILRCARCAPAYARMAGLYVRCWARCLFISNMVTRFLPNTAWSFSSATISRLFCGSWSLFFLM